MAVVNPPPNLRRPYALASIPGADDYLRQMEWIIFQLWQRTGGGEDIVAETANQQIDTDALFGLFAQFEELEQNLNDSLSIKAVSNGKNVVSTAANYTTVCDEVVICTSNITVTLNPTPDDLEEVDIKRVDGQVVIDGNGKTIDGNDTLTINRQYASLNLIYTVETDGWNIV